MVNHKIICGDSIKIIEEFDDESIDMIITSPPYDNLRNYEGYSFNFNNIPNKLFKIIKNGGIIVWVVGDSTVDGSESGESFRQALDFIYAGFNFFAKKSPSVR